LGQREVRLDAPLRREPSRLPLEHAGPAVGPIEEREALAKIGRTEALVLELVFARARESARNERAVRPPGVEATGPGEQPLAALRLELAPQGPCAAQQRNVVGVLVVREPDDPRQTARRAERVAALETR